MAREGEQILQDFLVHLGLVPKKIKEGVKKNPDYEIYKDGRLIFYVEEKTLDYDDFQGIKNDSARNKISTHIHKAVKQFKSVNPDHILPNVLIFNNFDTLLNPNDLLITLTGKGMLEDGGFINLYKDVGRIKEDLEYIDLYIWFNQGACSSVFWSEINKEHDIVLKSAFSNLKN